MFFFKKATIEKTDIETAATARTWKLVLNKFLFFHLPKRSPKVKTVFFFS